MPFPELRKDPVVGRWVIVSTERSRRPTDYAISHRASAPPDAFCSFCPGHEATTPPEITAIRPIEGGAWRKRVFRSLLPVIARDEEFLRQGEGMFDMMSGYGEHEIIVDSPNHGASYATMPLDELRELVYLWKTRVLELRHVEHFRSVTLFGNRGAGAGATMAHPHSQIIATPVAPRRLTEEISMCYGYFQSKERCVFCDLHESEATGPRRIHQNDSFLLLAPYASRFSYEMWILPRAHSSHFEEIDDSSISALAEMMGIAFRLLDRAVDNPPYSFVIHSAPSREPGMVHYHWHLEIMPRLSNMAGFEWGTGFYINSMPPEVAAETLRDALNNMPPLSA